MKLWNVQNGVCLYTWTFPSAVKRVEFSEDGTKLLAVIEQRGGHAGSVQVFSISDDLTHRTHPSRRHRDLPNATETQKGDTSIPTQDSKATVAGWSFLDRYIITGHENGSIAQWDAKVSLHFLSKNLRTPRQARGLPKSKGTRRTWL